MPVLSADQLESVARVPPYTLDDEQPFLLVIPPIEHRGDAAAGESTMFQARLSPAPADRSARSTPHPTRATHTSRPAPRP